MEQGLLFQMGGSHPLSKSGIQQHHVCSRRGTEAIALVNQVGSFTVLWMAAHGTLTDVL